MLILQIAFRRVMSSESRFCLSRILKRSLLIKHCKYTKNRVVKSNCLHRRNPRSFKTALNIRGFLLRKEREHCHVENAISFIIIPDRATEIGS